MATLFLFTNDLRLEDNPALVSAAQDDELACIYCMDDSWTSTDGFGSERMGHHRRVFLERALAELQKALTAMGQQLYLIEDDTKKTLQRILHTGAFDRVVRSRQHAVNEAQLWPVLQREFPDIQFDEVDTSTLYCKDDLPFSQNFPNTFSQFRRKVEPLDFRSVTAQPQSLPSLVPVTAKVPAIEITLAGRASNWDGSATAARHHLAQYFETNAASSYKETRNQFVGDHFSTGFSPWLANGALSPVQVVHALKQYESINGENESTGWITFELLWREFFRWHSDVYRSRLFRHSGIHDRSASLEFDPSRFNDWCHGATQWPLVNACMRELAETGWLSNRGRQLVASCLVNELNLDWRSGAGYFEQQLVDYDPCSNWGNWQYIAGVGVDPRGGRHFNIEKQGQMWDPDFSYRNLWAQK